ncbi:MAG: hypothetical protein JEY99_02850 [Spirochaetales bacterium]|nr:hypothetical protein [Spirochaetales bacterium]
MSTDRIEKQWIQDIAEKAVLNIEGLPDNEKVDVYLESERSYDLATFASIRFMGTDYLMIVSEIEADYEFKGKSTIIDDHLVLICPENDENVSVLRKRFPFTNPSEIGKAKSTFGVGDRLGIAGPGHLRVFNNTDMIPVLAQQSLRELELTGRKYTDIIAAASWSVYKSGYSGPWAADGDHLKHAEDVSSAVEQGCTMITADLSDHIGFNIPGLTNAEVRKLYNKLDAGYRSRVEEAYNGKISLSSGLVLNFDPEVLASVVLTYKNAIQHAGVLYNAAMLYRESLDFEISIDETELPTTLEAHYFVARELMHEGIRFTSIAPRFVGEFQKGIDYIGNLDDFETDFEGHAVIAADLGYKISVHSSSDKFSAYPIIAKKRKGSFHLKTSGTNWLIALEVVAVNDPELFRTVFTYAYEIFSIARAYYHVTPDMSIKTDLTTKSDNELLEVFKNPTDRQVLHISYGEVFKMAEMKRRLFYVFNNNISDYWDRLENHIGRHIEMLDS